MSCHRHPYSRWCVPWLAGAILWSLPFAAHAQGGAPIRIDGFELTLDTSARAITLPPGALLRITGQVIDGPSGAIIDAASEVGGAGRSEAGLVDPVASGLELVERHPEAHIYTYRQGNLSAATCSAAGLPAPCLILRLPQLAAARHRDVGELREELTGALQVEILAASTPVAPPPQGYVIPPSVPSPPPVAPPQPAYELQDRVGGGAWLAAAGAGGGLVLSIALLVLGLRRRRKSGRVAPLNRVRSSAGRLRKRLKDDAVKARLLAVVEDLAKEAESLVRQQERLAKAVKDAKPQELERKKAELEEMAAQLAARGGEEAGQGEMLGAAKIVQGQIDRCRKWEMQQWRSAARLERIATRLEALEAELDDPASRANGPHQELLDTLQEELDLARAGEREAAKLLGNDGQNAPEDGSQAA